tara:strand:- start:2490 stop:3503 length:1014 start_codon:yes stop_codon:yes gene_type:complete
MAQRDFTGAYKNQPLTAKEITTKKSQLKAEKINLQKLKDLNPKGGIERANFLIRYNNSIARIKELEDELKIAPTQRLNAQDKNIAEEYNLRGTYGRNFPKGPLQSGATKNISSSRKATEPSSQKNTNSEVKSRPPAGGNDIPLYTNKKPLTMKMGNRDPKNFDDTLPENNRKDFITRMRNAVKEEENKNIRARADDKAFSQGSPQKTDRSRFRGSASDGEGTSPTDANMNALEKLVSRIVGRNIRFEDIPEDDPFITDMPQNYQNLRRGGQVKRMGHGGAITPEQKKRISRIVQENKARKSKSTKATPTATTSKKRAAPFSDMKKARMNGNKKRTNR